MKVRVGVDLGKTRCRVQVHDGVSLLPPVEGAGSRGLAEPGGVDDALAAVLCTTTRALAQVPGTADRSVGCLAVGAAGAHAAPVEASQFATELSRRLPAREVAIASDAVTAHLGGLAGRPGVVLVAGTGAVAVGVGAAGEVCQVGGWGPVLGDDGSGAWIGREALRRVLRARDVGVAATALSAAAEQRYGDLDRLARVLSAHGNAPRAMAGFVPDVLRCAAHGDVDAADVVRRAARALADTTASAARSVQVDQVSAVGGLSGATALMDAWREMLPGSLRFVPPAGDALHGALMLTERTDLVHEGRVLRCSTPVGGTPVGGTPVGGDRGGDRGGAAGAGAAGAGADGGGAGHRGHPPPDNDRAGSGGPDVDTLATEQARPELADLDLRTTGELVDVLLEAESAVPQVVARARNELTAAVRLVEAAFAGGGRLIYVGAGTPGRLAAVDAAECPPTFGTDPAQVVAVLAGGDAAAAAAVEGAEDDAEAGARDLAARDVNAADVVVGITASGRTSYVLAALDAARRRGARTVAVVNNPDSPARAHADVTVELLTGPEVLAGSTRLSAGAAQKIVLNTLSTSAMIRTGKTYGAWMVDMVASNEKLRRRARRILREATGVCDDDAVMALRHSDWSTKVALVSILAGLDADPARARLAEVGGFVRAAVAREHDR